MLLRESESIHIQDGTVKRQENLGVIDVKLIVVQIGSYLGQDDIVRFDYVHVREMDESRTGFSLPLRVS